MTDATKNFSMEIDYNKKENGLSVTLYDILFKVHRSFGPGLLESVYEELISYELAKAGLAFKRQVGIPVIHEGVKLEIGFRADIIVEDLVIIEVKSIENLAPVHFKQTLTYLKLADKKLGLLVNFNVNLLKEGLHRIINNL
jgi:GxxExxY protein